MGVQVDGLRSWFLSIATSSKFITCDPDLHINNLTTLYDVPNRAFPRSHVDAETELRVRLGSGKARLLTARILEVTELSVISGQNTASDRSRQHTASTSSADNHTTPRRAAPVSFMEPT